MQTRRVRMADKPSPLQMAVAVAGRLVEVMAAVFAFPLTIAAGLASKIFDLISWLSNLLVSVTGGDTESSGQRTSEQSIQDKFLDALIVASVGWSANQWGLTLGGLGWLAGVPGWGLFACGLTTTIFTQCIQSRFLRRDTPSTRKREAQEYSQYKSMAVSPELIDVAQQKVREYNNAGVKSAYFLGSIVAVTWVTETWAMSVNATWPAARFSLATIAVLASCLFQALQTEALLKLKEARADG